MIYVSLSTIPQRVKNINLSIDSLLKQLQILQEDIKTLEKAVYSKDVKTTSNANLSDGDNDILTKHLLKIQSIK